MHRLLATYLLTSLTRFFTCCTHVSFSFMRVCFGEFNPTDILNLARVLFSICNFQPLRVSSAVFGLQWLKKCKFEKKS